MHTKYLLENLQRRKNMGENFGLYSTKFVICYSFTVRGYKPHFQPQAENPPLFGCLQLFIRHIHSYPPFPETYYGPMRRIFEPSKFLILTQ